MQVDLCPLPLNSTWVSSHSSSLWTLGSTCLFSSEQRFGAHSTISKSSLFFLPMSQSLKYSLEYTILCSEQWNMSSIHIPLCTYLHQHSRVTSYPASTCIVKSIPDNLQCHKPAAHVKLRSIVILLPFVRQSWKTKLRYAASHHRRSDARQQWDMFGPADYQRWWETDF